MSELKDPAIKLFGKTIPLPETSIPANTKSDVGFQFPDKSNVTDVCNGTTNTESEDVHVGDGGKPEKCIVSKDGVEDHIGKNNNEALVNSKLREDHDKVLKKPDKIIPCPRCKSLETKFCYFNNYNVNQPRHFCRNCQRYWTAGGAMRNVPVGAGRRKSKQLASQLLPCGESPTAFRPTTGNGSVLNFGSETPLSESMGTVLSRRDQKRCSDLGSVVENKEEDEVHERVGPKEKGDLSISLNKPTMSHSPQCYPIPQLVPALCAPNIPLQFVPAAYWGCLPIWAVGTGNMPMTPSSSCSNTLSNNVSPILGKHLRDENSMDEEKSREMHYHP